MDFAETREAEKLLRERDAEIKRLRQELEALQMRTRKEIEDQIAEAGAQIAEGASKYPGMSYEEGVDNALRWALRDEEDKPMEDG